MRIAKKLPSCFRSNSLKSGNIREVTLYVDEKFENELLEFLSDPKILVKYFNRVDFMLSDGYKDDIYGHEQNSSKSKDVYAMKIYLKGNHRIYCKEFNETTSKKIVLIEYRYKKTQFLNKELRNLVDRIGEYEYEFQE